MQLVPNPTRINIRPNWVNLHAAENVLTGAKASLDKH